jgi:hypothetical protein
MDCAEACRKRTTTRWLPRSSLALAQGKISRIPNALWRPSAGGITVSWRLLRPPRRCCDSIDMASTDIGYGVVNCGSGNFCCHGMGGCGNGCPVEEVCDCSGVSDVFSLPPGSVMTSLPVSTVSETSTNTATSTVRTSGVSTSAATTPASTATTTGTPDTEAVDSSNNIQSSGSTSEPGLSVGAKAGIGVACGTAAVAALAAAMLYRTRRRRRMQTKAGLETLMEKSGREHSSAAQQKHGQDQSVVELDAQDQPHELSDTNARSELEGAYRVVGN